MQIMLERGGLNRRKLLQCGCNARKFYLANAVARVTRQAGFGARKMRNAGLHVDMADFLTRVFVATRRSPCTMSNGLQQVVPARTGSEMSICAIAAFVDLFRHVPHFERRALCGSAGCLTRNSSWRGDKCHFNMRPSRN